MKVDLLDISGKKLKQIDLPDQIFGEELNDGILHSVIKAYRANRRQGTHATKTRSMVNGGGKKPFKQKGTGNARQGSSRSPLNPGGGVAHGPQPRNYREYVSKSARRKALAVALSDRVKHNRLLVVEDLQVAKYSTKEVLKTAAQLKLNKGLFVDERKDDFLYKSVRNIQGYDAVGAAEVNAEDILRHEHIVLSLSSISSLSQRFGIA